jgi:hypothetical protein
LLRAHHLFRDACSIEVTNVRCPGMSPACGD